MATTSKMWNSFYFLSIIILMIMLKQSHAASINATDDTAEDRAFKSFDVTDVGSGRTFGAIKRFQGALLPIMYKLGVMSAVIMMTLFLAFKGVFIGTLILVLNLTFFAIKLGSYLKSEHHHPQYNWSPPVINNGHGWPPHKDVHLHIHNAHGKPDLTIPYNTIGSGWETHSNPIEPTWATSNYVHSGRTITDNLDSFAPIAADKYTSIGRSRLVDRRNDDKPTIVMAESPRSTQTINGI